MTWQTGLAGFLAGLLISIVTSPAGVPGAVLGALVRVFAIPGPRTFRLVAAAVLLPLGLWLCARALRPAAVDRPALSRRTILGLSLATALAVLYLVQGLTP